VCVCVGCWIKCRLWNEKHEFRWYNTFDRFVSLNEHASRVHVFFFETMTIWSFKVNRTRSPAMANVRKSLGSGGAGENRGAWTCTRSCTLFNCRSCTRLAARRRILSTQTFPLRWGRDFIYTNLGSDVDENRHIA